MNIQADLKNANYSRLIICLILFTISLLCRLYQISLYPSSFFHDEVDNAINVISNIAGIGNGLFDFDWKPQPAFGVFLQSLSVEQFGPGVFAMRFPTAILSSIAVVLFYLICSFTFTPLVSICGAVAFGFHPGYLHFSRATWENSWVCLWNLLAIYGLIKLLSSKALHRQLISTLIVSTSAFFAYISYFGGRATIVCALILYINFLLMPPKNLSRRNTVINLILLLLVFLLFLTPYYNRPESIFFDTRTNALLQIQDSSLIPESINYKDVGQRFITASEWFFLPRHLDLRYFPDDQPLFNPLILALIVLGIIYSYRYKQFNLIVIAFSFVPYYLGQICTVGTPNFARAIVALPGFFILSVIGMDLIAKKYKLVGNLFIIFLSIYLTFSGIQQYSKHITSQTVKESFEPAIRLEDVDLWWGKKQRDYD